MPPDKMNTAETLVVLFFGTLLFTLTVLGFALFLAYRLLIRYLERRAEVRGE